MKILHIYKDYSPVLGGIEGHVALLARAQARLGHEVSVLVSDGGESAGTTLEEGVRVFRSRSWATLASTPFCPSMFQKIRRIDAEVTHLHSPYPFGDLAWQLAGPLAGPRCPTIVTYHSDIVRQRRLAVLYRPVLLRGLRRARRILVSSEPYLASSPVLSEFRHKCRVVPYGIDPQAFLRPDLAEVEDLRRQLGGPILLFVGRLRYYKGVDVLLAAMNDIDAVLAIVGNGPMEETWRRAARESPARARIHFFGAVPQSRLAAFYAAADVFVFPSTARSEAFGIALLEAMASSLPVVTTEVGTGTSFVNQAGETGLVVPFNDPAALGEAVRELLDDNKRREALGRQGRLRVLEHFTAERMVRRTMEVYDGVV